MFRRGNSSRRATAGSEAIKRDALTSSRLTRSMPNFGGGNKGIMKYVTEDESIHSKYGGESSKDGESVDGSKSHSKRVVLKDIQIREYARTIGDNPSCSSGPPIS
jgi:hypothetical protein